MPPHFQADIPPHPLHTQFPCGNQRQPWNPQKMYSVRHANRGQHRYPGNQHYQNPRNRNEGNHRSVPRTPVQYNSPASQGISSAYQNKDSEEYKLDWESGNNQNQLYEKNMEKYNIGGHDFKIVDNKKTSSKQSSGTGHENKKIDIDEIVQQNPGVSAKWLAGALNKPADLDLKDMKPKLDQIEGIWINENDTNRKHLSSTLKKIFTESENPYQLAAYFISRCKDCHVNKTTTLAFYLMKEFSIWEERSGIQCDKRESLLSSDLRLHVFQICTKYHTTMFDFAVKAFHLNYPGNVNMLPYMRNFLGKQKYKEVSLVRMGFDAVPMFVGNTFFNGYGFA